MNRRARTRACRGAKAAAAGLALSILVSCRSIVPLRPETRFGDRPAVEQELVLAEPCVLLPGGTPMGRPDGVRSHTLPAGRFRPELEDDEGIYFVSPDGIRVTEPAPRGTRTLPGGVYVAHGHRRAWEYLGDAAGVSARQPLPEHCAFRVAPRAIPAGGGI
jgi:hypothetical protein